MDETTRTPASSPVPPKPIASEIHRTTSISSTQDSVPQTHLGSHQQATLGASIIYSDTNIEAFTANSQNISSTTKNDLDACSSHDVDSTSNLRIPSSITPTHGHSSLSAALRVQTDLAPHCTVTSAAPSTNTHVHRSSSSTGLPVRTPSVKAALSASTTTIGSVSPGSSVSSPLLGSMADITPLPSPLFSGDSPGPWRRMGSRPGSRDMTGVVSTDPIAIVAANGEPLSSAMASQKRRRAYHGLMSGSIEVQSANSPAFQDNGANHASGRRSLSEYVPEAMQVQRPRQVTVSGAAAPPLSSDQLSPPETQMHREEYLATQRGLAVVRPPTPPPSNRSGAESDDSDSPSSNTQKEKQKIQQLRKPIYEYFYAATVKEGKRRRWRAVRQLGQGTFSKVILATSEGIPDENRIDEGEPFSNIDVDEREKDQRKLVAVKVIEHGPAGGADEQRVESSLKRELDILKSIRHPSLVHLRAFSVEHTRALLVLSYCPGGDMFDVASQHQHLLVPSLIRRMFCELVAAVRYLHAQYIVHRDIKLENVLLNLPIIAFPSISNWQSYPYAIITLTDLGLSRRILPPPDSPLLTTRCGSEDYASPELLMGQPYDGRATDAWALGVFLYALMEGRLPFDPLPSQGGGADARRMRSRTAHRVARCEWAWVKYADEEGEWDAQKGQELEGGREAVEGLLKRARSRLSLDTVVKSTWVNEGIQVDGGLRFKEEEDWDM